MPCMKPKLLWATVFLIAASIAVYVRLYPLRANIWSPSREQASLLAVYNIRQQLLQDILRQSPGISRDMAERLTQERFNETLHSKANDVRATIEKINNQLTKTSATPQPIYLLESDPFYFYNLTQNIINTGRMAETINASKYFNPLMCAPFGDWQPRSLHPYIGAMVYQLSSFFSPGISLLHAVALTPLIISVLTLIPFLWLCRLLSCGWGASLTAAIIFTLAPIYLKRSAFGWYDTDPYNLFFPLLLLGLITWGLRAHTRSLITGVLSGLSICLYALIWQGWAFIFFVTLASITTVAVYAQFISKDHLLRNNCLIILSTTLCTALFSIGLAFGFNEFFILIAEALGELHKFTTQGLDLWPNLFIGVGELKRNTAKDFLGDIGGLIILCLGLGGFIHAAIQSLKNPHQEQVKNRLLLASFLGATLLVTIGAQRFSLFTLVPLSVFAALSLQALSTRLPPIIYRVALAILISLSTTKGAADIAVVITPIYNSTWDAALTAIKTKTPVDSIINTWWPPGHFIKGIANRRVPFDGASLDEGAVGYWISNILLSTDEAHAQGLLRMLNLSGNRAADYLTTVCGLKLSQASALIHAIAPRQVPQARLLLKPFLSPEQINHLLMLTHAGHPHSYLLIYNELVDDNLILKFTGGWSFSKIESLNNTPSPLKQAPKRNSPGYIDFLWDIAGGPSKYSEALPSLGQQGNYLLFDQRLSIDLLTKDAVIESNKFGNGKPLSVVYLENGQIKEHMVNGGKLNYSVVLYQVDGHYTARLMDRSLANSLIIKLFFFDGEGLEFFKPFNQSQDLTGRTKIKTFQVIWND